MLRFIGLAHALTILTVTLLALRHQKIGFITKLNTTIILAWSNLVVTAILLSLVRSLDNTFLYLSVSVVLAVAAALLLGRASLQPVQAAPIETVLDDLGPKTRPLILFLLGTAALITLGNLVFALGFLPNNPDTVSYRLPRIYWYFSSGSLAHFAQGVDPRTLYYPLNGTLLQMPIVHYQWPARTFTFVVLGAWCSIALTTFSICRQIGFSRVAALAAAWIGCTAPGVLLQASSTNDEIIAAFILLIAVQFALRFSVTRRMADLNLALIGAGLSAGAKLHIVFFWTFLIGLGIYLTIKVVRDRHMFVHLLRFGRPQKILAVVALTAVLAGAFMVPNWRASGQLMHPALVEGTLNKPFVLAAGLQNLALHSIQIALSPIPDLNPTFDPNARFIFYRTFNNFLSPLFTWVNQGPAYMSAQYTFAGAAQSAGFFMNEVSVDIGFTYLLLGWAFVLAVKRRMLLGVLFSTGFFAWFTTYCVGAKYIEGFSAYLSYAFMVCMPTLAFSLLKTGRRANIVTACLLAFVAATNFLLDVNLFRFNINRNIPQFLTASNWPVDVHPVDDGITQAIRDHNGAKFRFSHWEVLYWNMMARHPGGRYFYDTLPASDPSRLNIYSIIRVPAFSGLVPVRVPGKPSPGMTLLGQFLSQSGSEWAFASGDGIDKNRRYISDFLVMQVVGQPIFGSAPGANLIIAAQVLGYEPKDRLQFQYAVKVKDTVEHTSDWADAPARTLPLPTNMDQATLLVRVRQADDPGTVTTTAYPLAARVPFEIMDP